MTKKELRALLEQHRIPVESWGKGGAKTMNHLLEEINTGECELSETAYGLVRGVHALAIDVFCDDFHLKEDRQEFADGRTRRRPLLERSVYEKLIPGEKSNLREAVKRAIKEELGIEAKVPIVYLCEEVKKNESQSYPGIIGLYRFFIFRVDLPESEFRPEGYFETQDDKTTFFVWTK